MNMIDRVARGIFAEVERLWALEGKDRTWESLCPETRDSYRTKARAACKARAGVMTIWGPRSDPSREREPNE